MKADRDGETTFRLYGKHRLPRSHRRVMLALLTGAPRLSGYPLSRLAQVGSGTVYIVLDRLENRGWVEGEWEDPNPLPAGKGRRRFYRLTPKGRAAVTYLLGLEPDGDSWAVTPRA
jgi:DNA-binding PadR family transcriptional regulator